MEIPINFGQIWRGFPRKALSTAAAAGLLACSALAYADSPITMAPPVDADSAQTVAGSPAYVTPNSVFNWTEMPRDQQVLITRAIFDRGGYQLYDSAGETIVVPFTNDNLYVMKFARSHDGRMYLVNEGDAPVLYVPDGGYLANATVSGARWYPFSDDFQPAEPVYMGLAPSWPDYVDMGWYPGMICSGGFYGYNPFFPGAVFLPTIGFFFDVGGHRFHRFDDFRRFHRIHPAPFRIGFHDRDVYRWSRHSEIHRFNTAAGRPYFAHRPFRGSRTPFFAHRTFRNQRIRPEHRFVVPARPPSANRNHVLNGSPSPLEQRRTFPGSHPPIFRHRNFEGSRSPMMDEHRTFQDNRIRIHRNRTFETVPPPATVRPTVRSAPSINGNRGQVFNRGIPANPGVTYHRSMPANPGVTYNRGMPMNPGGPAYRGMPASSSAPGNQGGAYYRGTPGYQAGAYYRNAPASPGVTYNRGMPTGPGVDNSGRNGGNRGFGGGRMGR